MTLSEAYDKMMAAYNTNDSIFASATVTLLDSNENPFAKGEFGHDEFENMLFHFRIWRKGGVGSKISARRMMEKARIFADFGIPNPYEKKEAKAKEETKETEETKEELDADVKFVINDMNNAHLAGDNVTFEQDAIHLVDIAISNPFKENSVEYNKFENVMSSSGNKKKIVETAKELCEAMNGTETYPIKIEPSTRIFGVLPEKKNRRRRKEGNSNDGQGAN